MDAARPRLAKRVRLVVALLYATSVVSVAVWLRESPFALPMVFIALGWPFIFRLVPRNYLYGTRTPRSLWTTEDTWYRQNIITGVFLVGVGVIWLGVVAIR